MTPEQKARVSIDALLVQAGWHVCNVVNANLHESVGVAIREFPLNTGFGLADYLLYVNGRACDVIEAKEEGITLIGVEVQLDRCAHQLIVREVVAESNTNLKCTQSMQQAFLENCFSRGLKGV